MHRLYVTYDKETITADDVGRCLADGKSPEEAGGNQAVFLEAEAVISRAFLEHTMPFSQIKELFEKQYLSAQLKKHESNVTRTAHALGLLPSALSRKLKDLGIKLNKGITEHGAQKI